MPRVKNENAFPTQAKGPKIKQEHAHNNIWSWLKMDRLGTLREELRNPFLFQLWERSSTKPSGTNWICSCQMFYFMGLA